MQFTSSAIKRPGEGMPGTNPQFSHHWGGGDSVSDQWSLDGRHQHHPDIVRDADFYFFNFFFFMATPLAYGSSQAKG